MNKILACLAFAFALTVDAALAGVNASTPSGPASASEGPVQVTALAIATGSPETVYAGTDQGVLRTTDGGSSWTSVNQGLGIGAVPTVAISGSDILALQGGRIFRSRDGGESWAESTNRTVRGMVTIEHPLDCEISPIKVGGSPTANQISLRGTRICRFDLVRFSLDLSR